MTKPVETLVMVLGERLSSRKIATEYVILGYNQIPRRAASSCPFRSWKCLAETKQKGGKIDQLTFLDRFQYSTEQYKPQSSHHFSKQLYFSRSNMKIKALALAAAFATYFPLATVATTTYNCKGRCGFHG
jgi:hypothetical protein